MLGKKSLLLLELFYIKNVSLFLTILSLNERVNAPHAASTVSGLRLQSVGYHDTLTHKYLTATCVNNINTYLRVDFLVYFGLKPTAASICFYQIKRHFLFLKII